MAPADTGNSESPVRFRPRPWPIAFTVFGLAVLIGLGSWQVQRLQWKTDLIVWRDAQLATPPAPLPATIANDPKVFDGYRFRRVSVTGEFAHDKEIYLAGYLYKQVGFQVITPMLRDGGQAVFVDRGWVPASRRDPASRSDSQVGGTVTVVGIARGPGEQGWFVPDNDAEQNYWFWRDISAMAAAAGVDAAPLIVQLEKTQNPGNLPIPSGEPISLRNDHLQYAITWYSLAVALVIIFYLSQRRRVD